MDDFGDTWFSTDGNVALFVILLKILGLKLENSILRFLEVEECNFDKKMTQFVTD